MNERLSSNEINVSSLMPGVYILKIQTSNGNKKYRFIKK
ncbi:T9SS type A sorting domain-containing protein [uncultured Apibacter sp.]